MGADLHRLIAAVVSLALAASCGSSGEPRATPAPSGTPSPGYPLEIDLELKTTGAETIDLDITTRFLAVELYGESFTRETWFLNGGTQDPIPLRENTNLAFSFDLRPGKYEGAKTYELNETKDEVANGVQSPFTDKVTVRLLTQSATTASLLEFNKLVQPCTLEVTRQARRGRLQCPALASEDGRTITVDASWTGRDAPPVSPSP